MIYKSKVSGDYYFNNQLTDDTKVDRFGFYLVYNSKPYFYEYYENEIVACNIIQLTAIDKSLKKYSQSKHHTQFAKTSSNWGYSIMRIPKDSRTPHIKECVMKFVKGTGISKYPGNVCIDANLNTRIEDLKEYILNTNKLSKKLQPELNKLEEEDKLWKKKYMCFLLEVFFRYDKDTTFYSYDKVWLKYI